MFRFYANNTELVEIESGIVENESINIALQMAVETAVLQTIEEGYEEGYWKQEENEELIMSLVAMTNVSLTIRG